MRCRVYLGLEAAAHDLTKLEHTVLGHDLVAPAPGSVSEDSGILSRENGSWLVDGTVAVDELQAAISFEAPSATPTGTYRTVGGLVMTQLQRIPAEGGHFAVNGFRFEVVDMDGRRIDVILVAPLPDDPPGNP